MKNLLQTTFSRNKTTARKKNRSKVQNGKVHINMKKADLALCGKFQPFFTFQVLVTKKTKLHPIKNRIMNNLGENIKLNLIFVLSFNTDCCN